MINPRAMDAKRERHRNGAASSDVVATSPLPHFTELNTHESARATVAPRVKSSRDDGTWNAEQARWHCLTADQAIGALGVSSTQGLSAAVAAERLTRTGPNAIQEEARRDPLRMLASQFADFMSAVLVVAAIISAVIGEPEDSIVILVIVVLNAIIGFVQEYRAERAMAALKQLSAANARALPIPLLDPRRREDIDATSRVSSDSLTGY